MTESSYNCQRMTVNGSFQHELSLGVMCERVLFESSCQLLVNELSLNVESPSSIAGGLCHDWCSFLTGSAPNGCVFFFSVLVLGIPAFVAVCSNEKKNVVVTDSTYKLFSASLPCHL